MYLAGLFYTVIVIVHMGLSASASVSSLSVSEIQATGKVLFRALRDSECKVKCKSRKERIMCGSDGVSYKSKCEVKRARRCEGKYVTIKRKGKCSEQDVPMTKCFKERVELLSSAKNSNAKEVFVPQCTSDGLFAEVQCHQESGYCWCVSSDGRPILNTSIKNGKPNCKPGRGKAPSKPDKQGKRCSRADRVRFNTKLVRVFTEEYNRSMEMTPLHMKDRIDPLISSLEKQVVEWKFNQYDENSDDLLQRKEVASLRRLVKKFIKPRSCAKRFLKYCDTNKDKDIQRHEWSHCLGVDMNYERITNTSSKPEVDDQKGEHIITVNKKTPSPSASGRSDVDKIRKPPIDSLPLETDLPWPDFSRPRPSVNKQERQTKDCLTDKQNALEHHADNPDAGIFIPTCTADGKFEKAQCHKSVGYCWCVDEETGRPFGGTATLGAEPNCDLEKNDREIPGCSFVEKQDFLGDLLNTLKTEMAESVANNNTDIRSIPDDSEISLNEKVARWKFTQIDTNKNQALDSKELKPFRNTTLKSAQKKATRKCARKLIKYCDADGNKRISSAEWIDCLGINKSINANLPANPKRTGKNPFDQYLRDT